jgi:hypothetical protein
VGVRVDHAGGDSRYKVNVHRFRVKDKEGIKDPKSSLNQLFGANY